MAKDKNGEGAHYLVMLLIIVITKIQEYISYTFITNKSYG